MSLILRDEYVTIAEAAELLQVSRSTIWRWIDRGRLPAYRIGQRRMLLKKDDLTQAITPVARPRRRAARATHRRRSVPDGRLTSSEQRKALDAIKQARRLQAELLAARGGQPFPSSWEVLDELRDERTRDLR